VIQTSYAAEVLTGYRIQFISQKDAMDSLRDDPERRIFTNSENALEWILSRFPDSQLSRTIASVKDKVQFRKQLEQMHPDYFYHGSVYGDLASIDPDRIPFPIILKPAVGFFSLGVQRVEDKSQWAQVLKDLEKQRQSYAGIYPPGVLNQERFTLEAVIPGEEFAVDCYFDARGEVVILNMMKHWFASETDMNDRVYITSTAVMEQYLSPVEDYLNRLGQRFNLKHFQAHIELRITGKEVAPIEVNPLRFGGWCSTADLAWYAWGMDLYHALAEEVRPVWETLIQREPGYTYALIVLNNSTGFSGNEIASFDYEALLKDVSEPLELRRTDFKTYPLFGFLMCRVPADDHRQLEHLLHSTLREYITPV